MFTFENKLIGIWGFGVVGKAVAQFLYQNGAALQVFDKKALSLSDQQWLEERNIIYDPSLSLESFLDDCERIIPSPGIDLRLYAPYAHKFNYEIDLFYQAWRADGCTTPIIAITGTMGKTSVTHLLSELLKAAGKKVATGGNIGIALVDLVAQRFDVDYCVIELSSFQLEHAQHFVSDIALWTNLFAKHLDRHETMDGYFAAKYPIMRRQMAGQVAIVPCALRNAIKAIEHDDSAQRLYWSEDVLPAELTGYEVINDSLVRKSVDTVELIKKSDLPATTFMANWILIVATLDVLGIDPKPLFLHRTFAIPEHRGECFAEVNGVKYFDDSKSTLFEATLKAIERLQHMQLIVLIGGISEGNDRCAQIALFKNKVVALVCFGAEAQELSYAAQIAGIPSSAHENLEKAVAHARTLTRPGFGLLLSPGGPSYDLFTNYHERGERFRSLVVDGR